VASPAPVARRFPVGEKEAQSIGDLWPARISESICIDRKGKLSDAPERVEEHLVAGRTLKMDWGEQYMTNTSSVLNAPVGWDKRSACMDFDMATFVGTSDFLSCSGNAT
jgi:hypothetical protein